MHNRILLLNLNLGAVVPIACGETVYTQEENVAAAKEYYVMHFVEEGMGGYFCNGQKEPVFAGQVFVTRPHEAAGFVAQVNHPCRCIWVGFYLNEPLITELEPLLQKNGYTVPKAAQIFNEIAHSKSMRGSQELFVCGKIYELLSLLMQTSGQALTKSQNYVLRAKDYIKANLTQDLSVQMIAESLGLSRSHFSTVFRQSEGVSPQDFIVNLRLCKAKELIEQYNYRPGQAAAACGYGEVFNFSKMFKRKFGVAPGQCRAGQQPQKSGQKQAEG